MAAEKPQSLETIATAITLNVREARQIQIALAERVLFVAYRGKGFDADYWGVQLEECQMVLAKIDRLFGLQR